MFCAYHPWFYWQHYFFNLLHSCHNFVCPYAKLNKSIAPRYMCLQICVHVVYIFKSCICLHLYSQVLGKIGTDLCTKFCLCLTHLENKVKYLY